MQLRLQVPGEPRLDVHRELDAQAQVVAGPELGQDSEPDLVPRFGGHDAGEPQRRLLSGLRRGRYGPGVGNGVRLRYGAVVPARRKIGLRLGRDRGRSKRFGPGLAQQEDVRLEGHLFRGHRLPVPHPPVSAVAAFPGGQAEVSVGHELDHLPAKHRVRVQQPGQRAVQEALAQAGQGPGPRALEGRRPVPVDVAGPHRLVQQGLGLQGADHPPAQRVAGAGVSRAQVQGLEAGLRLGVGQRREAVAGPHFVHGLFLRLPDLGPQLVAVAPVELGAQDAFGHLSGHALPGQPGGDPFPQFPPRLLGAPHQRARVQPRRGAALGGPPADALDAPALPFHVRVHHHQRQPRRILHRGAVLRKEDHRHAGLALERALDQLPHGGLDLRVLVQGGPPVADHLLQGRLVVDAEAVGADLADEEARGFEARRGAVDGGGIDLRFTEGEAQFGQVSHLVHLPAGRLEQDRRAHPAMDVPERPLGVRVQRPGARGHPCQVRVDGGIEARLAQLAEEDGAELRHVQRRRPQGDERLLPGLLEAFPGRPGDPLGQHGQRAAGLLELRQRAPLALEHRQRGRMKGVAALEPPAQEVPRPGLGRGVHRGPLRGQPGASLEAPVRIGPGDLPAGALLAQVLEQPAAHHLADLGLVVGDEVPGHPAHHLGEPVLPLLVPIGHLHLAARQADDRRGPGRAGDRHRQVLYEGVEAFGHSPVAVDEVQHLVEQQQHRRFRGHKHLGQRLGPRRRVLGRGAEGGCPRVAGKLARQVDPRRLPPLCGVPGVAHEDADPGGRSFGHARLAQQPQDPGQPGRAGPGPGQVVEGGQGMRLAAAELGNQGQHRGRVLGPSGQASQHHAGMIRQGPGEAGAREELRRVPVVRRRSPGHHLFQRNGELVRAERPAFADLLAGSDDLVPGVHRHCVFLSSSGFPQAETDHGRPPGRFFCHSSPVVYSSSQWR